MKECIQKRCVLREHDDDGLVWFQPQSCTIEKPIGLDTPPVLSTTTTISLLF